MKSKTTNPINPLDQLLFVYILLIILLILFSCNPVKQVLKDKDKLDKVAEVVVKSGYCANDTTILTKSDTTIVVDTLHDTTNIVEVKVKNDTVYQTKVKTVVKTVTIRDTIKSIVVDNARVRLLQEDILKLRERNISIQEQLTEQKRISRRRWWWIVLLIVSFSCYIFRKPIFKIAKFVI